MKLSISTTLFAGGSLNENHLALLPEYGFDTIEFSGPVTMFDLPAAGNVSKLAGWLKASGVTAASLHLPFYVDKGRETFHYLSLSEPFGPWLLESIDAKVAWAEAASELGCAYVVEHGPGDEHLATNGTGTIAPPALYEAFTQDQNRALYRRMFDEFYTRIEDLPLKIAVENVMTPNSRVEELAQLASEYPRGTVGINFDIGHANVFEHPVESLEACLPYVIGIHAHDNAGDNDSHLHAFDGNIPWDRAMPVIASAPNLIALTIEPMYLTADADMAQFRQNLSTLQERAKRLMEMAK